MREKEQEEKEGKEEGEEKKGRRGQKCPHHVQVNGHRVIKTRIQGSNS